MAKGNFFNLYFSNSDSEGELEGFDPENSSLMMLILVTICALT